MGELLKSIIIRPPSAFNMQDIVKIACAEIRKKEHSHNYVPLKDVHFSPLLNVFVVVYDVQDPDVREGKAMNA